MSHKAHRDLERRRSGLLAWSMRGAGNWFGNGGSDYGDATAYRVKRDGPDRPWRALAPDGTFLDSVKKLEQAKEACQRHHDKVRASIRERAVEAVDRKYGYTMEFSSCPEQHKLEYDEAEEALLGSENATRHDAALDSILGDQHHATVNATFSHFFESLGYGVTFEGWLDTGERWHEIYDESGIVCQVSFGTPLAEFLADLPYLVENKPGIGPTDYWCACKDDEKLRELLARARAAARQS